MLFEACANASLLCIFIGTFEAGSKRIQNDNYNRSFVDNCCVFDLLSSPHASHSNPAAFARSSCALGIFVALQNLL